MRIGILGTGAVGRSLGNLLAAGGHSILFGARMPKAADEASLKEAVEQADLVLLAIPFDQVVGALSPLRDSLTGKIMIDATNPLGADWSPLLLGEEDSAAETIQRTFPEARVVKAFNTVFADVMTPERLQRAGAAVTAFIASDDRNAASTVEQIAVDAGFDPLHAGPLSSARWLEAIAHLNIRLAVQLGGGTGGAFLYSRAA